MSWRCTLGHGGVSEVWFVNQRRKIWKGKRWEEEAGAKNSVREAEHSTCLWWHISSCGNCYEKVTVTVSHATDAGRGALRHLPLTLSRCLHCYSVFQAVIPSVELPGKTLDTLNQRHIIWLEVTGFPSAVVGQQLNSLQFLILFIDQRGGGLPRAVNTAGIKGSWERPFWNVSAGWFSLSRGVLWLKTHSEDGISINIYLQSKIKRREYLNSEYKTGANMLW